MRAAYASRSMIAIARRRAVNAFVAWGRDLRDQKMKSGVLPGRRQALAVLSRATSLPVPAIAAAAPVDLTIVPLRATAGGVRPGAGGRSAPATPSRRARTDDGSADMGTGFDCFSGLSHTASPR